MFKYTASSLVSLILSCILWGFYTCLFVTTMAVMYARGARMSPVLALIISLYIMNSAVSVFNLWASYSAFTTSPEDPDVFLSLWWTWGETPILMTLQDVVLSLSSGLADSLLIWRAWIIWNRDIRVLLFPIGAVFVACVGCTTIIVYDILMEIHGPNTHYYSRRQLIGRTMFGLTISVCLYVNALICGRLWYVRGRVKRHIDPEEEEDSSSPYLKIILVLIECGALYSVWMLAFLIAYCSLSTPIGWFWYNVGLQTNHMIVGIVPTMVVLQLSLGHLQPHDASETLSMSAPSTWKFKVQSRAEAHGPGARISLANIYRRRGRRRNDEPFARLSVFNNVGNLDFDSDSQTRISNDDSGVPRFDADNLSGVLEAASIDVMDDDDKTEDSRIDF